LVVDDEDDEPLESFDELEPEPELEVLEDSDELDSLLVSLFEPLLEVEAGLLPFEPLRLSLR
jgi:hypothetical protein